MLPLRALVLLLRALELGRFFVAERPRAFLLVLRDFVLALRDFVPVLRDLERFRLRPRSLVALRALEVARFLVLALRPFVLRLRDLPALRALVVARLEVLRLRPFAFDFMLEQRDLERFVL